MTTTKTREGRRTAYVLLWMQGELVHTLVYSPPTGSEVRTYFEGHLDPRAGEEESFPRFTNADEAVRWMWLNQGEKCLVALRAAKRIYGTRETYAEPV